MQVRTLWNPPLEHASLCQTIAQWLDGINTVSLLFAGYTTKEQIAAWHARLDTKADKSDLVAIEERYNHRDRLRVEAYHALQQQYLTTLKEHAKFLKETNEKFNLAAKAKSKEERIEDGKVQKETEYVSEE